MTGWLLLLVGFLYMVAGISSISKNPWMTLVLVSYAVSCLGLYMGNK